ncbi:hypothetical protein [Sphingobium yanoikuyae]|uniref:hypothetical protein n=1 Tax=Sphingobium yanoikuyae TaxID=13690 RepID=UPI0022DE1215|nr:hypothetical protein [Sphingobium yanoikuyae]WBQ19373.1 hypothetical protein PAE53_23610 [Sphingobium yanoikuyae]
MAGAAKRSDASDVDPSSATALKFMIILPLFIAMQAARSRVPTVHAAEIQNHPMVIELVSSPVP